MIINISHQPTIPAFEGLSDSGSLWHAAHSAETLSTLSVAWDAPAVHSKGLDCLLSFSRRFLWITRRFWERQPISSSWWSAWLDLQWPNSLRFRFAFCLSLCLAWGADRRTSPQQYDLTDRCGHTPWEGCPAQPHSYHGNGCKLSSFIFPGWWKMLSSPHR